jgi:hypothetical protein
MAHHNRWQSFETTEPVLAWSLVVVAPTPGDRRAVVDEVLAAGARTGVLLASPQAVREESATELLPWNDAVASGQPVPFSSRVFVRDATGGVVERTAADAGALLRQLEPIEALYARHFAAARPFAVAWTTTSATALEVTIAYFTSLWLEHGDEALHQKNLPALMTFRDALVAVARRRGGRIEAPLSPLLRAPQPREN